MIRCVHSGMDLNQKNLNIKGIESCFFILGKYERKSSQEHTYTFLVNYYVIFLSLLNHENNNNCTYK